MRGWVIAAAFSIAGSARADEVDLGLMTETARHLAASGQCDDVHDLGAHVRALDADYEARVFEADPAIASCRSRELAPPSSIAPREPVVVPRTGEPKSVATAVGLSIGTTAAGVALLVAAERSNRASAPAALLGAGLVIAGPSVGRAYVSRSFANPWLVTRLLGLGAVAGAGAVAFSCLFVCDDSEVVGLEYVALAGAAAFVVGSVVEIATTPAAVHDYNRAHGWESTITVAPIVTRGGAGLGLGGRF